MKTEELELTGFCTTQSKIESVENNNPQNNNMKRNATLAKNGNKLVRILDNVGYILAFLAYWQVFCGFFTWA